MFKKWFAKSARSVPLRAYGKLPFAAEYRRIVCDTGTAATFTRWLDEGRAALLGRAANAQILTSTLCISFNGSREWVLGRLWDSRDSLGRRFPFCFFVVCPSSDLGESTFERFAAAVYFGRAFEAAWRERAALSGRDFARVYGDFQIDCPADKAAAEAAELRRIAAEWAAAQRARNSGATTGGATASAATASGGSWQAAIDPNAPAEPQAAMRLLERDAAAVQAAPAWLIVNDAAANLRSRLTVGTMEIGSADYAALSDAQP